MGQADASGILALSTEERCNGVYALLPDLSLIASWSFPNHSLAFP